MIISHEHKFIFIHIPRTAGTRISKSLCESMGVRNWQAFIGEPESLIGPGKSGERCVFPSKWIGKKHIKADDLKSQLDDEVWDSYFKFAFVRNPWDRTVSTYLHRRKVASGVVRAIWPESRLLFNAALIAKYDLLGYSSVQQKKYVTNKKGSIIVDFIGRFENLEEDFGCICDRIGLKSTLGSKYDKTSKVSYKKWYNKIGKKVVQKVNKKDIKKFGYKFD